MTDFGKQATKLVAFHNGIFENLNDFRKQNLFCDVTIDANGKLFPCHRMVLIATSPYFRTMFNGNFQESSTNVAVTEEIEAETMDMILEAIYTARIRLLSENVYFIWKASHYLQLDAIANTCVACIMKKTPYICHLIEICLFAKSIGVLNVYDKCVQTIADDLVRWSKTDMFKNLSFDFFNLLLSKRWAAADEDEIFLSIVRWSKFNNAKSADIFILLESAKLKSKTFGVSVLSELIVTSQNMLLKDNDCNESAEKTIQSNSEFKFNLYMNAVEIKTGAKGWGTLKLNESFDKYSLSNFQVTYSPFVRICRVGTKMYCFEWNNNDVRKPIFSCYENDSKTELTLPENFLVLNTNGYEMLKMDRVIYVICKHPNANIWAYDCQLNTWKKVFEMNVMSYYNPVTNNYMTTKAALYDYSDWFTLTSLGSILYVVGCKFVNTTYSSGERCIKSFDDRFPNRRGDIQFPESFQHENAAVTAFDGKIVLSGFDYNGVLHNTFSIFDVKANKWLTDIEPMRTGRARHHLIHRNGFVYAVENIPFRMNEKYDVNLNSWTEIPCLPRRVLVENSDDMVVSTGYVFDSDVN